MGQSEYVRSIRTKVGCDLLLLPGVTALIHDRTRFLLARSVASHGWSFIGGGVEPGEDPRDAVAREVQEELGADVDIHGLAGVYGGEGLTVEYPNGDRVSYVTTVFECTLRGDPIADGDEVSEIAWFTRREIDALDRQPWIDRVLADVLV